jgi:hypothetical protein
MTRADPALLWGLALAIVVEGLVVHLLLAVAHPRLAWTLSALAASSLVWLAVKGRRRG